ncbi:MAG: hypothetical protein ACREMW_06965 [Gemmatimonadales bacterium]
MPWGWAVAAAVLIAGCGGKSAPQQELVPAPTAPLPTAGLASNRVPILPFTLVVAEDSLRWEQVLADRKATIAAADSVLGALLTVRAPEVTWVLPDEVRRQARRSPTFGSNPDQMATALLRNERLVDIPDPLRSELRTLVALAGARYALVPAALVYLRAAPDTLGTGPRSAATVARAELSIVLVDARLGRVGWRTVARGEGNDPWTALTRAVKALTPGLP